MAQRDRLGIERIRALAGDIVLRSWARHFTLTVPLFIQGDHQSIYCWEPCGGLAAHSRRSRNTPRHATQTGITVVL